MIITIDHFNSGAKDNPFKIFNDIGKAITHHANPFGYKTEFVFTFIKFEEFDKNGN